MPKRTGAIGTEAVTLKTKDAKSKATRVVLAEHLRMGCTRSMRFEQPSDSPTHHVRERRREDVVDARDPLEGCRSRPQRKVRHECRPRSDANMPREPADVTVLSQQP